MSRFEPNVEPSMEEILASIRRIIAEDTSGSRTTPPPAPSPSPSPSRMQPSPVRSNAGARPGTPPQRGFMSRNAFMKSPTPAEEPSEQRFFTPVTPHDPLPSTEAAPVATPEVGVEKASPSLLEPKDVKVEAKPAEAASAKVEQSSETAKSETKLEKTKQEEPTVVEVKAIIEAEQKPLTPEPKSEAQLIDAQLVELLGEDLKALRESDGRQDQKTKPTEDVSAKADTPAETSSPRSIEPAEKTTAASEPITSPAVHAKDKAPDIRESADPFAFDLGPSPFLPRSLPQQAPEQKNSVEPTPAPQAEHQQPQRSFASQRDEGEPSAERIRAKINGIAVHSETEQPTAPSPRKQPEPVTPPEPQRPATFAVPSVSATLGPHRRLEPLSESFKPAPAPSDYRKPVETRSSPFPLRDFGRSSEPSAEPRRDRSAPPPPPPLSALPPLDVEASPVISGDRTMEDAVADLLRPLLKTWLAENMPKIVERALRREMTERLLPGQKNFRD
ncbi:MAG TPA: DUF2497 domain-containing protein [Hyphomicrobium sp.]|nr:DUF2497 domain-containing protein [Hyphomicrobium sp.]